MGAFGEQGAARQPYLRASLTSSGVHAATLPACASFPYASAASDLYLVYLKALSTSPASCCRRKRWCRLLVEKCVGYDMFPSRGNTSSERAMKYITLIWALPQHLTRHPREDVSFFLFFLRSTPAVPDCTRYEMCP